ncbi:extracellular solute-binding protein [Rossellomorea marisflavi]|uniref:Extracellular solute-binding protein n=1 Tax=Rossellomorea marisflavi TaxID=189381 RepID=A0A5D4RWY2_9BACI|nr:extracellular solute-binding protein [Rossellomorea marisflavi]MBV6682921.1 extracellular solute-binding protein [Bacillus sp. JRC01]MCM2591339.1 extracellular solute-binding protein [Rossellomorea marisflavi]MDW4526153.1 extracellular solute-binding protein [Rossellomorea marisflavi]TYS54186.1 extracellular solute-binding protein [Rossellomorea marisflavi]UKS66822.1 extracellular solute-binding protein [Rossellomorea marisflavi]
MKKVVSLFMVLLLVAGVLAACGPNREEGASGDGDKKAENKDKPEKLVVWEDEKKSGWLDEVGKKFTEETGIELEVKEVEMASKMKEQLRLDGPAGTGPDVVTFPHDQIGELALAGHIAPLEVSDDVKKRFTESSILAESYDGKLYGLPKSSETPVFIYNKELMKEAPASMDDVYSFAKDFTKDGNYGFLALWDNFYFAHAPMGGYGGYVFAENDGALDPKDLGLNNDGAVEGTEYIQKWYKEGLFPKGIIGENGGSAMDGLFNEGKVASVMNGPWSFQGYKDAGIDIGVTAMPKLPNGEPMKTFMGVKGWHVSGYSKNKEWAQKFVEFITEDENAKYRFEQTQEVPTNEGLINDSAIAENEGAKAVAEQSKYAVPMPNIPEMGEVWDPMAKSLQTVVTGKQEPKAALDAAVKQIEDNIKANHSN